jgi:hypothetical protein
MKNINMRNKLQYIFEVEDESLEPTNTDKFPITKYKGFDFGLNGNTVVYKSNDKWIEYTNSADGIKKVKKDLYNLVDEEGNVISIYDTPENTDAKTKTNEKCLPLKTPPAGLTLNIKNPGDKNYIYGKVGEEWFAQNVKNKKIFNLTKCNYTTSITKLEKLKTGSANASVEQLQNQSKEIQQSAGLPKTGSFDIQSLERLIKLLSDEEQPKVQSVQDLIPNAKIQTPNAEEQLKQIASQQTIRQ